MAAVTIPTRGGGRRPRLVSQGSAEPNAPPHALPAIDFQLVGPEFVDDCLTNPAPSGGIKVLAAQFDPLADPLHSNAQATPHIPGAILVHPSYLESGTNRSKYYPSYEHPTDGNLLHDDELVSAIRRLGITPETLVIVYGSDPDGMMAAARLVWALMYAGVGKIRLLDGGLRSWLAFGGTTSSLIRPAWDIGRDDSRLVASSSAWRVRAELLATTDEVRDISQADGRGQHKLVDVRGPGEWDGTLKHHYPFFSKSGHIPTAIFQGDWDNLLDMESRKIAPALDSVAQRWREQGVIDPGVEARATTVIFYCGTGWRSSLSFLAALLLGVRAKNYDDGFYGWSWGGENEIALGRGGSPSPMEGW